MPKNRTRKTSASLPCSANIAQFRLDNGIRLYVYENFASPAIVMNGYLIAGARDETPDKAGLASFTVECLMRGSEHYTYEQVFEETESIGASLSISSGMHTTGFFAKSLAEDMPLMCDLLSDVLRRPTFPAEELEKERNEWFTGLEERANSTRAMTGLTFSELCYPDNHPYHYSTDGTTETARAIARGDVVNFHRDYISPQDMAVCVVGAVDAAAARDRLEAAFGDWHSTRPARAALPPVPRISGRPSRHTPMAGKSQTNLMWGYPGPSRLEPDWISCSLMNSILGQFGMYGRLGERVRKEEGLVYYIGSRFEGGIGPGAWYIHAGTNPKTVERVVDISVDEVRRIQRRKVTAQELEDNKSYFTGVLPLQMESNEGMAGQIINMVRYDLGLDYLLHYPQLINAITLDDIRASAQKWLDPENFVLTSAGS